MKPTCRLVTIIGLLVMLLCVINVSAFAEEAAETGRFPSGVIEVPQGTTISIDDDSHTVTIVGYPVSIAPGDTFVVYLQDLPIGYVASQVNVIGDRTVIQAQKADASVYGQLEESGEIIIDETNSEYFPPMYAQQSIGGIDVGNELTYEDGKVSFKSKVGEWYVEAYISNLSLSHSISADGLTLALNGNWGIEDQIGVSDNGSSEALFQPEISLGEIRIHGVGKIALKLSVEQSASMKVNLGGTFSIGFNGNEDGGNKTKHLTITERTIVGEGRLSASLKVTAGIDVLVASADLYGEVAATTEYDTHITKLDNPERTVRCENWRIYIYLNAGVEAQYQGPFADLIDISGNIGFVPEDKQKPFYFDIHLENGHVTSCTVNWTIPEHDHGDFTSSFGSTLGTDGRDRILETSVSLPYDVTINGDYRIGDGSINLNGHTLTINGDLIQEDGTININNGILNVTGDYRIQSIDSVTDGVKTYADSKGSLIMNNSQGEVNIGGSFIVQTTSTLNRLTAGRIVIDGNLEQVDTAAKKSIFNSGSALQLTMSRARTHTISIESPEESYIGKLVTENNTTVNNDIHIGSANLSMKTLTVNGRLYIDQSGTFAIQGGKLVVNGDLYHHNGTIDIALGKLNVSGNYYNVGSSSIIGGDQEKLVRGTGILHMVNATDEMHVGGRFVTYSGYDHSTHLTAGTLYLAGDFRQIGTNNGSYADTRDLYNFPVGENHKTVLNGTGTQNISFESSASGFGTLEATNTKIVFAKNVNWLKQGSAIQAASNNAALYSRNIDLNGQNLTINGNVKIGSNLNVNSGTLTVSGNVHHFTNTLNVNKGKVTVGGNYYMVSADSTIGGENEKLSRSTAILHMVNATDEMHVGGQFVTYSGYDHSTHLTAGTLYLAGDFRQIGTNNGSYADTRDLYNFPVGENHKTVLNGTGTQNISFESTASHFGTLVLEMPMRRYEFSRTPCWLKLIESIKDEKVLILPSVLNRIEEEAFVGIGANVVEVPEGCISIGARAFADCPNLYEIIVSKGTTIEDSAFEGCNSVFINWRD